MSREIVDTTSGEKEQLPDGGHVFTVTGPLIKKYGKTSGKEFYIWPLKWLDKMGIEHYGDQLLMTSNMGGLLRSLGAKEINKNVFDFDTEEFTGKSFYAEVSFKPDSKDPKIMRQYMGKFAPDSQIPF